MEYGPPVTESQSVAMVLGPILGVWGIAFFIFRRRISRKAIAQRIEWNKGRGVKMQTPLALGIGGIALAIFGFGLALGALFGVIR